MVLGVCRGNKYRYKLYLSLCLHTFVASHIWWPICCGILFSLYWSLTSKNSCCHLRSRDTHSWQNEEPIPLCGCEGFYSQSHRGSQKSDEVHPTSISNTGVSNISVNCCSVRYLFRQCQQRFRLLWLLYRNLVRSQCQLCGCTVSKQQTTNKKGRRWIFTLSNAWSGSILAMSVPIISRTFRTLASSFDETFTTPFTFFSCTKCLA